MNIFQNWTVEDCLTLSTTILMAIGGIFALYQWRSSIKIRRSEFLKDILNTLRFDENMAKAMYTIEYNPSWYSKDFQKSELEFQIDKLLSFADFICYLYDMKNISYKEFIVIKYEINRICRSNSVQSYLWNLYHFSKKNSADGLFMHLIDYGIKENIISDEFKKNDKNLYVKYLDF